MNLNNVVFDRFMCQSHALRFRRRIMVRKERLELSHLEAPEPKSGESTNSATSASLVYFLATNIVKEVIGESQ